MDYCSQKGEFQVIDFKNELINKVKILNETIWEHRVSKTKIDKWLGNFKEDDKNEKYSEQLHALYLLSQFMYFGDREIRELLKAMFRDLYKYPIIDNIRKSNSNTTDLEIINKKFDKELRATRFLGVGNPSESGTHLLYYFRQENNLPKSLFIHTHEIFKRNANGDAGISIRNDSIKRYVFLDDLCGSGDQAVQYSQDLLEDMKRIDDSIYVAYYAIFASEEGINNVKNNTMFDSVQAIYILDKTFKCFNSDHRYFVNKHQDININFAENMCHKYGKNLFPSAPLGYEDGQLLIGFHHNIPDNTLPIIWHDELYGPPWFPIFRRYPKIYE
jgi:hypothetical protein